MSGYQFTYQTEDPDEVQLLVSIISHAMNTRGIGSAFGLLVGPSLGDVAITQLIQKLGDERCRAILLLWCRAGTAAIAHVLREGADG